MEGKGEDEDPRTRSWAWLSWNDEKDIRRYAETYPKRMQVLLDHCTVDESGACDATCTPVGYALSCTRWMHWSIKRFLVEHTSLEDTCYVADGGTTRYDMLSCAVAYRKNITTILETKQLSLSSTQKAIGVCEQELSRYDRSQLEKSDMEHVANLIVNCALLEKCLEQQSNVFAASVWSFRQTFVGDHQTVFDTLAEVWRNGFYYFQSP